MEGKYFEVFGADEAYFFGCGAYRDADGQYLTPMFEDGSYGPLTWGDYTPQLPAVEAVIREDEAKGNGDSIAYLVLGSHKAAHLWAEGVLTAGHLLNAQETENAIVFRAIFAGREVEVRVMDSRKLEHQIATYDAAGAMLP